MLVCPLCDLGTPPGTMPGVSVFLDPLTLSVLCDRHVVALRELLEWRKRHSDGPTLAERLAEISEKPDPENGRGGRF